MAGRKLPTRLLRHSAVPVVLANYEEGDWIEGEPGTAGAEPSLGASFPCVLFVPVGTEQDGGESSWRRREIKQPQCMWNLRRRDGSVVEVGKESELIITAPDLAPVTGGPKVRWQVVGAPQAYGRPGQVFGALATLKRLED